MTITTSISNRIPQGKVDISGYLLPEGKVDISGYLLPEGIVDKNMPNKKKAEILVNLSRKMKHGGHEKGDDDDKFLISKEGLESLIGAGAEILWLNKCDGSCYFSEVNYSGRRFIHGFGKEPIAYIVEP